MKITRIIIGCALAVGIGCCCLAPVPKAIAADSGAPVPAIVQEGFKMWAKQEISSYAIDVLEKGRTARG